MADRRLTAVNTAELREQGFTVVRGFVDAASCRRAREAIDAFLGSEPTETVSDPSVRAQLGHESQGISSGFLHSVTHPNPAMAVMAHYMPKMVDAHVQTLRSSYDHIRLNGQTLLRTDPYDGEPLPPQVLQPNSVHVDNAFLAGDNESTPRKVYSRSIVYLNKVRKGGAGIIVWPRSFSAARKIVEELVAKEGEVAYHGGRWRNEIIEELDVDYSPGNTRWAGVGDAVEVLMEEGDMVFFEPMCMHSASRCTNGEARYCWVNAFYDERAQAMPHRLYQDTFSPEFLAELPSGVHAGVTGWLPDFVEKYKVPVDYQYWCYGVRTAAGMSTLDHSTRRHRAEEQASKL